MPEISNHDLPIAENILYRQFNPAKPKMERFFLNRKMERVWQRDYANHLEAIKDIAKYIVGFYNCVRLHSTLGNLPPMIYEMEMAEKELIDVSDNT